MDKRYYGIAQLYNSDGDVYYAESYVDRDEKPENAAHSNKYFDCYITWCNKRRVRDSMQCGKRIRWADVVLAYNGY